MTDKAHTWQYMPEPDSREVGVAVLTFMGTAFLTANLMRLA